jgi:single-stranded DNA-binding protein
MAVHCVPGAYVGPSFELTTEWTNIEAWPNRRYAIAEIELRKGSFVGVTFEVQEFTIVQ